ncbi:MAG: hypothetical protein QGG17_08100 [Rhodospirillales bacterium]|jgi:hypothetical protein|nr:hypothetical protein [Rhodospirillales bacterium]MDP6804186.1 hypothetical protein [Rhodospirillales bacterium]
MARSGRTKTKRKARKRAYSPWRGVGRLIALLGFSIAALGLVVLAFRVDAEPSVWETLFADRPNGQHVLAGGIFLGMNADALQRYHPDVDFTADGAGGHRGTVRDSNGVHTVWFTDGHDGTPAFRLTSELTLVGARMDEVLELFGGNYGRPSASGCERSRVLDAVKCHFRWLTGGPVSIDLHVMNQHNEDGGTSTKIRVVAADINLETDRLHARVAASTTKIGTSI